mmetsp:Transcript_60227/g.186415  ORF Transcript_60227/g.186415 Transcript_60227/m.186415 type:complete len:201 (+) Transcript_60227:306-908(+)
MLKPFKSSFKVVKSWIDTRRDQLASISPADLNSKPLSMPEGDPHLLPAVGAAAYDTRTTPMPAYDLSMPTWSSALPPWGMKATPMVTSEPTSMAMSPGLPLTSSMNSKPLRACTWPSMRWGSVRSRVSALLVSKRCVVASALNMACGNSTASGSVVNHAWRCFVSLVLSKNALSSIKVLPRICAHILWPSAEGWQHESAK